MKTSAREKLMHMIRGLTSRETIFFHSFICFPFSPKSDVSSFFMMSILGSTSFHFDTCQVSSIFGVFSNFLGENPGFGKGM